MFNPEYLGTDIVYPLLMDVYYPIVEQGAYGDIKKTWVFDKSYPCFFNPAGRKFKQDLQTDTNVTLDNSLVGRSKNDILTSVKDAQVAMTNVLITNIRGVDGIPIYTESSGIRVGKSTLFEIATYNPIVGPFANTEYYKIVISRSDNQGVEI
jgi:hypothetical protein